MTIKEPEVFTLVDAYRTPKDLAADIAVRQKKTAVVRVTPERAAVWLEKNTNNRNVRRSRVEDFARDMVAGKWSVTNQGIGFDIYGNLVDGQHRLHAVIEAGIAVDMLVVYGLDPQAKAVIDTGKARTPGDMLSITEGMKDPHAVAGLVRLMLAWRNGAYSVSSYHATHSEIREFVQDYPHRELLNRAVEVARMARRPDNRHLARPALMAMAYLVCAEISREDAEEFFVVKLLGRVGLVENDPVAALHRRLSGESGDKGTKADFHKLAYIFAGWNKYRRGEKAQKIQAPDGGFTSDNFWMPR